MPLIVLKGVCSSPLLKKVDFILFLNKCDLLKSKLRKGIPIWKYVASYDGAETFEDVIRCTFVQIIPRTFLLTLSPPCSVFKSVFTTTWRHANERLGPGTDHGGRSLHIHRTNMVDSRATKKVLIDGRLRHFLQGDSSYSF